MNLQIFKEGLIALLGIKPTEPRIERGYVLWHESMEAYLGEGKPKPNFVNDINRAWFVPDRDELECPAGYQKVRAERLTLIEVKLR